MSKEADDIAKLVPIGELKCGYWSRVGPDRTYCDKPPTHQLYIFGSEDELMCEEHGRKAVQGLLPARLRGDGA